MKPPYFQKCPQILSSPSTPICPNSTLIIYYLEIAARIIDAVGASKAQKKPNLAKLAREFAVPYGTLRNRSKGKRSIVERPPNGRKLNAEQAASLSEYIDSIDKTGTPLHRSQIHAAANSILKEAHTDPSTEPPIIGPHWVKRFLRRHPEYDQVVIDARTVARPKAVTDATTVASPQPVKNKATRTGPKRKDRSDRATQTDTQLHTGQTHSVVSDKPLLVMLETYLSQLDTQAIAVENIPWAQSPIWHYALQDLTLRTFALDVATLTSARACDTPETDAMRRIISAVDTLPHLKIQELQRQFREMTPRDQALCRDILGQHAPEFLRDDHASA